MNYSTLASTLGFSRYNPNGIQLLTDGGLLLKVSERSTMYNDTMNRNKIEFSYEGHVEGTRGSRNNLVRNFIRSSSVATPRVILAVGRYDAGNKYKPLIWTYEDRLCIRGLIEKGFGACPEFVISPLFKLEWNRFSSSVQEDET